MLEESQLIWQLLQKDAHFYVSGSAKKMPSDVRAALKEIVQTQGNLTVEEAEEYVKQMEKIKQYQVETWN